MYNSEVVDLPDKYTQSGERGICLDRIKVPIHFGLDDWRGKR